MSAPICLLQGKEEDFIQDILFNKADSAFQTALRFKIVNIMTHVYFSAVNMS